MSDDVAEQGVEEPGVEEDEQGKKGAYEFFDLSGSGGTVHEKWPTLNLIDERTATLMTEELSRVFAESVEVQVIGGGVSKFRGVAEGLEQPGCLNYLEFEALGGFGLLAVEQQLVFVLLERLFGGGKVFSEGAAEVEPRERFSGIEERVIRRLVVVFGRALEEAWRPIVPLTMRHVRVETKPVNVAIARPGEWVIVTDFRLSMGAVSGQLKFVLPHLLLKAHRDRLATGQYEEKGGGSHRQAIRQLLVGVPVDIVAELGRAKITIKELLRLKVGDVLRLDQSSHDPVGITVEDVPKYRGKIMVRHGNLAVEVQKIHERALMHPEDGQ